MQLGVTGSRFGPTRIQLITSAKFLLFLEDYAGPDEMILHHGMCQGFDTKMHEMAKFLGWPITAHPGITKSGWVYHRAENLPGNFEVRPEFYFGVRNQDIVDESAILVAAPQFPENHVNSKRSGTWQTVRMARKAYRPIFVVPGYDSEKGSWYWEKETMPRKIADAWATF